MQKKRIEWIDNAKGIGIVLVILGHIILGGITGRFIYSFHMPLFFVISGYLYNRKEDFIKRRAKQLIIPYFLVAMVSYFYWLVFERFVRDQVEISPLNTFISIFTAQSAGEEYCYIYNIVLWFLPCLFCVEVLFYILDKLFVGDNIKIIASCCIVTLIGHGCKLFCPIRLPFCLDVSMLVLGFYAIGYIFRKVEQKTNFDILFEMFSGLTALFLTVLAAMYGVGINLRIMQYPSIIILYIMGLSGSYGIYVLSKHIHFWGFEWLGRNSLIIMCIHEPIKRVVIVLVGKVLHLNADLVRGSFLGITTVFMVLLVVCICVVFIVNWCLSNYRNKILGNRL